MSGSNSRAEGTDNQIDTGHTTVVRHGVTTSNVYYGTNTNNPVGANQVDTGNATVVRDGVIINVSSTGVAPFGFDVASFVQNMLSGTTARPVVYVEGPPVQQLEEDRELDDDPDAPKCCICLGNAPICIALPCLHKKFYVELDDPDAPKCCICLGNAPICVALPCLHKKFCVKCARYLCYGQDGTERKEVGQVKCPFCNEVVDKFCRVFE